MGTKALTLTFTRGLPAQPTSITWIPEDGVNPLAIRIAGTFRVGDTLTLKYSTDAGFMAGVTTEIFTITSVNVGNGYYDYIVPTVADGTYYTEAQLSRTLLGTTYDSGWKAGDTFTISTDGTWPTPADFTITSEADWTTFFTDGSCAALRTGGGTIDVAIGDYTPKTFTLTPSATLLFRQQDLDGVQPHISGIVLNGATNISFYGLDLSYDTFDGGDVIAANTNVSYDIAVRKCTIRGNYLGDIDYDMDPSVTYAEDLTLLPNGIAGNSRIEGLIVEDTFFYQLYNGIKVGRPTYPKKQEIRRNKFNRYFADDISGNGGPDPSGAVEIEGNLSMNRLKSSFGDASHSDFAQFYHFVGHTLPWDNCKVNCNVALKGTAVGSSQFLFTSAQSEQPYRYFEAIANISASTGQANQFSASAFQESYLAFNSAILYDPADAVSTCDFTVTGKSYSGAITFPGHNYIGYNIAEIFGFTGNYEQEGNLTITAGSLAAYQAAFAAPTSDPTTIAEAVAAYEAIGAFLSAGATFDGLVDWTTFTIDRTKLPVSLKWDAVTDAERSTTVEAAEWSRFMGGPESGTLLSVVNGEYAVADDIDGTNAGAYSSLTRNVIPGQYVKPRRTSSANYSATVDVTLTANGKNFTFSVTTVSSGLAFDAIANSGSAYSSRGANVSADANIQKYLVACRFKFDADGIFRIFSHNSTNGRTEFYKASTSKLVLSLGQKTMEITYSDDQAWHTLIGFIDTTQADAASGFRAWIDNVEVTYLSRAFTSGALTSISTALGQLNLFSKGGNQTCNGRMQYLWMDWGAAAYSLLDVSQQANRDLFLADNIDLVDGSGPTGSQPKLFFTGNQTAAVWNAGLPNLGSAGGTWSKVAGTYT